MLEELLLFFNTPSAATCWSERDGRQAPQNTADDDSIYEPLQLNNSSAPPRRFFRRVWKGITKHLVQHEGQLDRMVTP